MRLLWPSICSYESHKNFYPSFSCKLRVAVASYSCELQVAVASCSNCDPSCELAFFMPSLYFVDFRHFLRSLFVPGIFLLSWFSSPLEALNQAAHRIACENSRLTSDGFRRLFSQATHRSSQGEKGHIHESCFVSPSLGRFQHRGPTHGVCVTYIGNV